MAQMRLVGYEKTASRHESLTYLARTCSFSLLQSSSLFNSSPSFVGMYDYQSRNFQKTILLVSVHYHNDHTYSEESRTIPYLQSIPCLPYLTSALPLRK